VTVPDVLVEPVEDAAAFELVELVAADALSQRAVSELPNDGVMARLVVTPIAKERPASARSPMLVVVVGQLRGGTPGETMLDMRSRSALTIAVVLVDSLAIAATAQLQRAFDCVVPVLAAPAVDPEPLLTRAVSAVTAFATANRISIPVDEIYPLFERAGRATWGCGEDANIVTAAEVALAGAGLGRTRRPKRVLLHVESTDRDYVTDLRLAAEAVRRRTNATDLVIAASVRGATEKRVSVVAVVGG
jgi:hypothetical protein